MKKIISIIINSIFFLIIIIIAVVTATIALTKKVNDDRKLYNQGITGTVIKQEVPILSFSQGVVKNIDVRVGQNIKIGDPLMEIENPVLVGKIQALKAYPDNISAQTEAKVAQEELKGLNIISSINGVVTEIDVTEGSPIENLGKVMVIYSNDNIHLLAHLTDDQFQKIEQLHQAVAYSTRLNQNFVVVPDILSPDEKLNDIGVKQIGLYFKFKNKTDAASLLNNEDLTLNLSTDDSKILKPVDFFVNFWNSILSTNNKK